MLVDNSTGERQFVYVVGLMNALNAYLEKTGWTKVRLQMALGISPVTYYRWARTEEPIRSLTGLAQRAVSLLKEAGLSNEVNMAIFQYYEDAIAHLDSKVSKNKEEKPKRTAKK